MKILNISGGLFGAANERKATDKVWTDRFGADRAFAFTLNCHRKVFTAHPTIGNVRKVLARGFASLSKCIALGNGKGHKVSFEVHAANDNRVVNSLQQIINYTGNYQTVTEVVK